MKNSIIVLQARTNSSRLPGKVFLPIRGVPLVVLSAQRASNLGREIIVATSEEGTDDELSTLVANHGFNVFRGSLDDVLSRFCGAIEHFSDDAIVFRLTADNVIPDGALLNEIEEDFISTGAAYMACAGKESGLPYGVSVEVMYAKHIREANKNTDNEYDREHVTPYIRRVHGVVYFSRYKNLKRNHFRVTIDNYDDYESVKDIFADVNNPVEFNFIKSIWQLSRSRLSPHYEQSYKPMTLGAAQLGLDYGITNSSGMPSKKASFFIIKKAISEGVEYIDTAHAYGESEVIIGEALSGGWEGRCKIITKLSPLTDLKENSCEKEARLSVEASIYCSMARLKTRKLDVVMLHRASHISMCNGSILSSLINFKDKNIIEKLGVSVQSPVELERALECEQIEFIQLPYNILDYRWDSMEEKILRVKSERNLTIHARSSLLQGLLASNDPALWEAAGIENHKEVREWLSTTAKKLYKMSVADLCIGFVNSIKWIDSVVIGVENKVNLLSSLHSVSMPLLSNDDVVVIKSSRPTVREESLNPVNWKK